MPTASAVAETPSAQSQEPGKEAEQHGPSTDSGVSVLGSSCTEPFCSKTDNESHLGVYVGRDWTCDGTTGTARGESCVSTANRRWISPDQRTPSGQDWDAFRVDAGYCYKVRFSLPYDAWVHYYNRSNTTAVWVKVENHAIAFVQAQRWGSCP
ncbi:hypothetical protein GCM10027184_52640 [Saccharothrix stipae]